MNTLFIDIETIPCQHPDSLEGIRREIKPPGNIKKQESIDKWMEEKTNIEADKLWRKTALNGTKGEILCIGFAINDGPSETIYRTLGGPSERAVLKTFYQFMSDDGLDNHTRIVGHNVKDFDLRFMFQRSVINGVEPTIQLHNGQRYTKGLVYDTMTEWAGWGNRISLKNLCSALGVSVKEGDIDGSKIWDAVLEGRYTEISDYCKSDVDATREVYKKMTFGGGL